MKNRISKIIEKDNIITLSSPYLTYELNMENELKASYLKNKLSDNEYSFKNSFELRAKTNNNEQRLYITGWKIMEMGDADIIPNNEPGYKDGYHLPEFNDRSWEGEQCPWAGKENNYKWARTYVFIPENLKGLPFTLVVGGNGLRDYGYLRAFINGEKTGVHKTDERWHEPGKFTITKDMALYSSLRFGTVNVVALQMKDAMKRAKKLDELDPLKGRELALMPTNWPIQFEQYFAVGKPNETICFNVDSTENKSYGDNCELLINLKSKTNLDAVIKYKWDSHSPYLHKYITIKNTSDKEICLLDVHLGEYDFIQNVSDGEQGFPVYVNKELFLAIAHPSGWATGKEGKVLLKQYPGIMLASGQSYECMEVVLGVADTNIANNTFTNHIKSRMRRTNKKEINSNHVYSIYDCFGSWGGDGTKTEWKETEEIVLNSLEKVAKGQIENNCTFDYYSLEFWVDFYGDITRAAPKSFPHQFENIKTKLKQADIELGLWIDSSVIGEGWGIGGNPVLSPSRTFEMASYAYNRYNTRHAALCRASDPYKSIFNNGFLYQIRENNARLLKFDNAMALCHNPKHEHLPGIYSTEAIQSAIIESLKKFNAECSEVFLMLYWGHRSPWWLLYADTLFESGLHIEASTPASFPTLYSRDGVTLGLDQAQWWCKDIPPLGKDSLGVWLSEWAWNSSIGKERWQEGIIMDMCRGNMLFQVWGDGNWLSHEERNELAFFKQLFINGSSCFANTQFIIGNPWNNEPYGYCCSDGERAFIAVNNCSWDDLCLKLELNDKWGIKPDEKRKIIEWYPKKAVSSSIDGSISDQYEINLRPFTIALYELYQNNKNSCMDTSLIESGSYINNEFVELSCELKLDHEVLDKKLANPVPLDNMVLDSNENNTEKQVYKIRGKLPKSKIGGIMVINVIMTENNCLYKLEHTGRYFSVKPEIDGIKTSANPIIGLGTYPVPWQGFRINVKPTKKERDFQAVITAALKEDIKLTFEGHFIPSK